MGGSVFALIAVVTSVRLRLARLDKVCVLFLGVFVSKPEPDTFRNNKQMR